MNGSQTGQSPPYGWHQLYILYLFWRNSKHSCTALSFQNDIHALFCLPRGAPLSHLHIRRPVKTVNQILNFRKNWNDLISLNRGLNHCPLRDELRCIETQSMYVWLVYHQIFPTFWMFIARIFFLQVIREIQKIKCDKIITYCTTLICSTDTVEIKFTR